MQKLKKFAREQIIFLTVAFVSFATQPAIVRAQDVNPLPFTEALSVSRGSVTPASKDAIYLTTKDACTIATYDWDSDEKDAIVADIEESLRIGLAEQGRALGVDISFTGWSVYPTLNTEKQMMYYATNSLWNGEQNVNLSLIHI